MPPRHNSESLFLNVFAFLYTGLLMVALALTAYRELLNTAYIWFTFTAIPLPTMVVLAGGDGTLPVVFYTGLCGLLNLINLIIIFVNWAQQGSFYLNLGAVDNGWFGLYVLIADLLAFMVTSGLIIYFLLQVHKQANKFL
jgi:hypothetical protein